MFEMNIVVAVMAGFLVVLGVSFLIIGLHVSLKDESFGERYDA